MGSALSEERLYTRNVLHQQIQVGVAVAAPGSLLVKKHCLLCQKNTRV